MAIRDLQKTIPGEKGKIMKKKNGKLVYQGDALPSIP